MFSHLISKICWIFPETCYKSLTTFIIYCNVGCAMAQVVGCWPIAMQAYFQLHCGLWWTKWLWNGIFCAPYSFIFLSLMLYNINDWGCHEIRCLQTLQLNRNSIVTGVMMRKLYFLLPLYILWCVSVWQGWLPSKFLCFFHLARRMPNSINCMCTDTLFFFRGGFFCANLYVSPHLCMSEFDPLHTKP